MGKGDSRRPEAVKGSYADNPFWNKGAAKCGRSPPSDKAKAASEKLKEEEDESVK